MEDTLLTACQPSAARRRALAVAFALSLVLPLRGIRAEIVDTLGGFEADSTGWTGALAAGFSVNGGNTELVSVSGSGRVQWQNAAERVRFLAGGTYESADGERIAESLVLHLRHNHRFLPWLRSLAFTQLQQDPFQRLESRTLFGAGVRVEPLSRARVDLALGAAYMLELERLDGVSGTSEEHRLSTFLDVTATLREGVTVEATAFVQPRWDDFADLRVSSQAALASRIVGTLSLVLSGSYIYDRDPPEDVEPEDWTIESGLRLSL